MTLKDTKTATSSKKRSQPKDTKQDATSSVDAGKKRNEDVPLHTSVADANPIACSSTVIPDVDAIQLFRRYDRSKIGFLRRNDFLELLRDYANPVTGHQDNARTTFDLGQLSSRRSLIALTDSAGIPLGCERTGKNSEFEAGQLFERYDRDHKGMMTLDKFLVFYADYKPQLVAFVADLQDRLCERLQVQNNTDHFDGMQCAPSLQRPTMHAEKATLKPSTEESQDFEATYKKRLWELHILCKRDLSDRQHQLGLQIDAIRRKLHHGQKNTPNSFATHISDHDYMQSLLEKERHYNETTQVLSKVRALLRNQKIQKSSQDYPELLHELDELQVHAQHVIMTQYEEEDEDQPETYCNRLEGVDRMPFSPTPQIHFDKADSLRKRSDSGEEEAFASKEDAKRQLSALDSHVIKQDETFLRIKDQIIFQLLQERAKLRKEKASLKSYVAELSSVSTQEMKEWASLTDKMQAEIERLRASMCNA